MVNSLKAEWDSLEDPRDPSWLWDLPLILQAPSCFLAEMLQHLRLAPGTDGWVFSCQTGGEWYSSGTKGPTPVSLLSWDVQLRRSSRWLKLARWKPGSLTESSRGQKSSWWHDFQGLIKRRVLESILSLLTSLLRRTSPGQRSGPQFRHRLCCTVARGCLVFAEEVPGILNSTFLPVWHWIFLFLSIISDRDSNSFQMSKSEQVTILPRKSSVMLEIFPSLIQTLHSFCKWCLIMNKHDTSLWS